MGVHPETGPSIHLDDGPTLLPNRKRDVGCHEIHAGYIQAHHPGSRLGNLHVLRMCLGGAIDRGATGR